MRSLLRSILAEPRVPDAPARVWRDWALLGVLVPIAIAEAVLRSDLPWRWVYLAAALVTLPTLLVRRTHPFHAVAIAFGTMLALAVFQLVDGYEEPAGVYAMGGLVITLYALTRWGSGRESLAGGALVLTTGTVAILADAETLGEVIGGYAVLGIVATSGATVRFLGRARHRELEQVRSTEREHIARDLHDTVAHHVSAIAIRAQAGLAVAPTRPDAAVEALRVIEAEASRTLAEMRAMVGVLRRHDPAELAPTPTIADVERLASAPAAGPPVRLEVTGDLHALAPAVETAVFRLVQESVTNARRHARRASTITVSVHGDGAGVDVCVADDGEQVTDRVSTGYGIIGMVERAGLLGGSCEAGPGPHGGWVVRARLPRAAVPA